MTEKPPLQVLIATQNNNFRLESPPERAAYLYINQNGDNRSRYALQNRVDVVDSEEIGLSNSRNLALATADGDICLIADSDVQFISGYENSVLEAFEKYPEADLITFQIQTPDGEPYKRYEDETRWHSWRTIGSVSSIEIAFRREAVIASAVQFDSRFGLGAKFPSGEENLFLRDCLNAGLRILYLPCPIVLHPKQEVGARISDGKFIKAKGALYYRLYGSKWPAAHIWYAIRMKKHSAYGFFSILSHLIRGALEYRNEYR